MTIKSHDRGAGDDSLRSARRVTSSDVARAAGVSRATVSYVLNAVESETISEATRQRVLKAAEELGHVPNAPARSLRRGRSDIVLVLVRDFDLSWIARNLLDALDVALATRGMIVLIDRYDSKLRSVPELWQLVTPSLVLALGGLTIPEEALIEVSSEKFLPLQGMVPNVKVGEIQADYLVERGHTRLAYALAVTSKTNLVATDRLTGFQAALRRHGVEPAEVLEVDPSDAQTARRAIEECQARGLTAIAAQDDDIALVMMAWMAAMGITPGRDLAVIGVDDVPAAAAGLTTVRIEVDAWSTQIVAAVEALLDDRPAPEISHDIIRLMPRTSA
ncbi:MAG TPA: LacI family DNA-binding transcriptional regulator [Pseudolysinimonas sp.]|jgi:DNA-binding LacI/PurR family transcriptional regulator